MPAEHVTLTAADVGTLRIVEGVGTAGLGKDKALAARIEQAMSAAITQALADGISINDTATMQARMMAARAAAKHEAGR